MRKKELDDQRGIWELGDIFRKLSKVYGINKLRYLMENCVVNKLTPLNSKKVKTPIIICRISLTAFKEGILSDCDTVEQYQRLNNFFIKVARIVHQFKGELKIADTSTLILIWRLESKHYQDKIKSENKRLQEMATIAIISILKVVELYYTKNELEMGKENSLQVLVSKGVMVEAVKGTKYTKIDIEYFGRELTLMKLIQELIHVYKCPFILTGEVFSELADCLRMYCREIDKVKLYSKIYSLYSLDLDNRSTVCSRFDIIAQKYNKDRIKLDSLQEVEKYWQECSGVLKTIKRGYKNSFFQEDTGLQDIVYLDLDFKKSFRAAYDFYTLGIWKDAKKHFQLCLDMKKDDGPTLFLLEYLKQNLYSKPRGWRGYRLPHDSIKQN